MEFDIPLYKLQSHRKGIMDLCVSKDAKRLISCGLDHYVKIYDTENFNMVHQINYKEQLMCVQLTPDNVHLIVGLVNGSLSIRSYKKNNTSGCFTQQKVNGCGYR
eukprot:UN04179